MIFEAWATRLQRKLLTPWLGPQAEAFGAIKPAFLTAVLAGLGERRRELAILRSVGAGPQLVFMLLALEGILVVTLGALLGALSVMGISLFAGPLLQARLGVSLTSAVLSEDVWLLLLVVIGSGALVSLIPGYRAYRLSLADGLTPKL